MKEETLLVRVEDKDLHPDVHAQMIVSATSVIDSGNASADLIEAAEAFLAGQFRRWTTAVPGPV